MRPRIYGPGLIRTAKRLADPGDLGRPSLSDLRRGTSTAYYALFHQITGDGARDFLPDASPEDAAEIARWYTHRGVYGASNLVRTAAREQPITSFAKTQRTSIMALRSPCDGQIPSQLLLVAGSFMSLQDARHSADYDGNFDPVRATTRNHIEDAEAALKASESLWRARHSPKPHRRSDSNAYAVYLRLALLLSGGPKSR